MTRNGTENDDVSLICENGFREPKVALFLDVPNILMSLKGKGQEYDPSKVLEAAERIGRVTQAVAYTRLSKTNNGLPWWISKYRGLGFELKFIFDPNNGSEPKDVDTQLVTDAVETAFTADVDVFVIASGDGDYVPLVHLLRKMGKATIVIGVSGSVSRFLSAIADKTVFLDDTSQQGAADECVPEVKDAGETEGIDEMQKGYNTENPSESTSIRISNERKRYKISASVRGGGV